MDWYNYIFTVEASVARGHHACVPLNDGKALIAGGGTSRNYSRILLDSVQVCFQHDAVKNLIILDKLTS